MPLAYDAPRRLGKIQRQISCWICGNDILLYGYHCKYCAQDAYNSLYNSDEENPIAQVYYAFKYKKVSDEWREFLQEMNR
jgi:predicted amidophosphoribosyltransferase